MSSVSCINFFADHLSSDEVTGKSVLEIGSLDINGSPRLAIQPKRPQKYVGVDRHEGKGVDKVLDLRNREREFGKGSFDVVISSEFLERVEDWRWTIWQMKNIVKLRGLVLLTVRAPGFPAHSYVDDRWRYSQEDLKKIFADFEILELREDPLAPGVFLKAKKPKMVLETDLRPLKVHQIR